MNRLFRYIVFSIAALSLLLSSCKKDDTLRYGNVTMGNFVGDKFISDQGNEFNIVENLTGSEIKDIKRAIMQCDVLSRTAGTENGYDVRVHYVGEVFTKAPIEKVTAAEDSEKLVEDPISIQQIWISGGYINMYVMFEIQMYPKPQESKHMLNLVYEGNVLTLRHNAYGETLGNNPGEHVEDGNSENNDNVQQGTDLIQWGFTGAYVSFQVSEIVTEQNAEFTLNWKEHKNEGNNWLSETVDKSIELSYSKNNFEQAPLTFDTKRMNHLQNPVLEL